MAATGAALGAARRRVNSAFTAACSLRSFDKLPSKDLTLALDSVSGPRNHQPRTIPKNAANNSNNHI